MAGFPTRFGTLLLCGSAIGSVLATSLILGHGLPALRHDWRVPAETDAVVPWVASWASPWLPSGIGEPQPYPTFYYFGVLFWPLAHTLSSLAIVVAIVFGTILSAGVAAGDLARRLGARPAGVAAVVLLAQFNPWVYSKEVAGHIFMVTAYASTIVLLNELNAKRQGIRLALATALTVTQLEFLLLVAPVLAWIAARRRDRETLVLLAISIAPIAVGIACEIPSISATPFNLVWQRAQSIDLYRGLFLLGYSFEYASAFSTVRIALAVLAVASLAGLISLARTDRTTRIALGGTAALLLFTSGTRGPFNFVYDELVIHIPAIGVFRELYDLLGLVAIAYCNGLALASRARYPALILLCAALALPATWVAAPPWRFFVDAATIPRVRLPEPPPARFALHPAFQPLTLATADRPDVGSGVDPDAYARVRGAQAFNEFFPGFPIDAALSYSELRCDDRRLAALGVTIVIDRPYLRSDQTALRPQRTLMDSRRCPATHSMKLEAMPIAALAPGIPPLLSIGNEPSDFGEVFWESESGPKLLRVAPAIDTLDPQSDWVDIRLAVPSRPEWGSALGGAFTMGKKPLSVPAEAGAVLASVDVGLTADSEDVPLRVGAWHWAALPANIKHLVCMGTCAVGAFATEMPPYAEHETMPPLQRLHQAPYADWLDVIDIPAAASGTLRLATRFDTSWVAVDGLSPLRHFALAQSLNAWHVPPNSRPRKLIVVEVVALSQVALETVAVASLMVVCARRRRVG